MGSACRWTRFNSISDRLARDDCFRLGVLHRRGEIRNKAGEQLCDPARFERQCLFWIAGVRWVRALQPGRLAFTGAASINPRMREHCLGSLFELPEAASIQSEIDWDRVDRRQSVGDEDDARLFASVPNGVSFETRKFIGNLSA